MEVPPLLYEKLAPILILEAAHKDYAWGSSDPSCCVAQAVLQASPTASAPFAEAWFGAHASGPARIVGHSQSLAEVLSRRGSDLLGEKVNTPVLQDGLKKNTVLERLQTSPKQTIKTPSLREASSRISKFGSVLPYLPKLLAVGSPLSIQVHPGESEAKRLFASNPERYPDPFPKAEALLALTEVELLNGFRPWKEIDEALSSCQELALAVGAEACAAARLEASEPKAIKLVVTALLNNPDASKCARTLVARAEREASSVPAPLRDWITRVGRLYPGGDVGLFFFYFCNLLKLLPGQALFTPTGIVHAYLSGEMLEIMWPSDNVIRCGLTPKFIDRSEFTRCTSFLPLTPSIVDGEEPSDRRSSYLLGGEFLLEVFRARAEKFCVDSEEGPELLISLGARAELSATSSAGNWTCSIREWQGAFISASVSSYNILLECGELVRLRLNVEKTKG